MAEPADPPENNLRDAIADLGVIPVDYRLLDLNLALSHVCRVFAETQE